MIKSINIPKKHLLNKTFGNVVNFTDNINVIYAPNGAGKTVLINTLAHNAFVKGKGWSQQLKFGDFTFQTYLYNFDMAAYLRHELAGFGSYNSPAQKLYGECTIDWDGIAVFKSEGITNKQYLKRKVSEIMCGCPNDQEISKAEMKNIIDGNLSSGQTANRYIENFMSMEVPDLMSNLSETYTYEGSTKTYFKSVEYENLLSNYVSTLPRDGKPTLLIDEIDSHFDFDNLVKFWNSSINKLAEKYQIIIVTHNPLFINKTMNIIGEKYYLKSIKNFKNLYNV